MKMTTVVRDLRKLLRQEIRFGLLTPKTVPATLAGVLHWLMAVGYDVEITVTHRSTRARGTLTWTWAMLSCPQMHAHYHSDGTRTTLPRLASGDEERRMREDPEWAKQGAV